MENDSRVALLNYMRRIGAEELNFRRWMVKVYSGAYYREVATVRVDADGSVTPSKAEFAPTEAEAAAIKAEAPSWKIPNSCVASPAALKKFRAEKRWPADAVFEFYDDAGGIIMLQVRVALEGGGKAYVPWTFWGDGAWRAMEPDGPLPFYRPREATSERIMVHEGAKSAHAARAIVARSDHPWARELAEYEHWGMIGGALAPHRSDWAKLRQRKPVEVVYFCDNDQQGIEAMTRVSRAYGMAMTAIEPYGHWPQSWDIADPLPPETFSRSGRYIGPQLHELKVPATWATEAYEVEGSKRTHYRISPEFNKKWIHIADPELYIGLDHPSRILTASQFDHVVAPFSDLESTSRKFKEERASAGSALTYDPSMPSGLNMTRDGGKVVNTHTPAAITPEAGCVALFEDYLAHLVPDNRDRHEVKRWCATLIARPDVRMQYGMLMVSETQGVGKTTLGDKILAPLVGERNVSRPGEEAIVTSQFNDWVAHKRLAIVNELYAGSSSRAYNKLKSIITDDHVTINRKYVPEYTVPNWLHVFANSNSFKALKVSQDDRRWLVPGVTEEKRPWDYWEALNDWLRFDGGLNKIAAWARIFVEEHGCVNAGEAAPMTNAKAAVIEEGLSPMELWIAEAVDRLGERFAPGSQVFFCDGQLIEAMVHSLLEGSRPDYLIKPLTVRKIARAKGWHVAEGKAKSGQYLARGLATRIMCRCPEMARAGAAEITREGKKPIEVNDLAGF